MPDRRARSASGLRRVVVPVVAPAVIGLACAGGVMGCSSFSKALGQQQAVVTFRDGTPDSVRLQVRTVCGQLPNVSPAPLPKGVPDAASLSEVVFEVDHASTSDEARLQQCLAKYPSVQGLDFQDSTDEGS